MTWRIELFGGLRLVSKGETLTRFRTRKTAALLAFLAYQPRRMHSRDLLVDLLWPEDEAAAARHSLRTALSALRRDLERNQGTKTTVVLADHFSAGLNPAEVTTDVEEFEGAISQAQQATREDVRLRWLLRAEELYTGELLTGFYEEWIAPEQQLLEERYFHTNRQLIALLEVRGEVEQALQLARRAVRLDPLREESHRELIRLLALAGEPDAALRQYGTLEQMLRAELGSQPSAASQTLIDRIRSEIAPQGAIRWESPATALGIKERRTLSLEPPGGAVPVDSKYFLARAVDEELAAALSRRDSVVLLKGARQSGKSSLLVRGLASARDAGCRVAVTNLQVLQHSQLESLDEFLRALARLLAEQLQLTACSRSAWDGGSSNLSFWSYFREQVLEASEVPLVWILDDVDRLFTVPFGEEVFALFRSWHNERAYDPTGPWSRLTLAIGYATEAYLFVQDLNQSPFNVGTRIELEDFTLQEVAELNRRYGAPLEGERQLTAYYRLVGGHPHLVRCGLHEMAVRGTDLATLEARGGSETGPFGSHLRRMYTLLVKDRKLCEGVIALLEGKPCPTVEGFFRLRTGGVILGDGPEHARLRCGLYAQYLARRFGEWSRS